MNPIASSTGLGNSAGPVDPDAIRRKVAWHVLPLIFVLYIVAYLDRSNAGYAKLAMAPDLKFSDDVFGWGLGIFFIGYLFLEIPGALLVERWSARKWFARILISWGLVSALTAFVRTPMQFYVARFLLGVAEAGFFPGLIVYFTHWFASRDRGRALSGLIMAVPVSLALGSPVSGLLLKVHWWNLAGWKWIFLVEGVPAIVLGIVTLFVLDDYPHQAKWLTPPERDWLVGELEKEAKAKLRVGHNSILKSLKSANVWLIATSIFAANMGGYAFTFWLPTSVKSMTGWSDPKVLTATGFVYLCGIIGVFLSGRSSDHTGDRKWHAATGMALCGFFLSLSCIPGQPFGLVIMWLCFTSICGYFWPSPFWALPTLTLSASAAAVSIAVINMMGNVSGFFGNRIFGRLKSLGFGDRTCLLTLACCFVVGAIIVAFVKVPQRERESIEPLNTLDPVPEM